MGALGSFDFPRGLYLYAGSAWGGGGLAARVGRHLRGDGRPRWHVDHLRRVALPAFVALYPHRREECALAQQALALPGAQVVAPRFGASDCRCAAHLVHLGEVPWWEVLARLRA